MKVHCISSASVHYILQLQLFLLCLFHPNVNSLSDVPVWLLYFVAENIDDDDVDMDFGQADAMQELINQVNEKLTPLPHYTLIN